MQELGQKYMVVGRFSRSVYLMKWIHICFGSCVQNFVNPLNPYSAISEGVVMLGMH